MTNFADVPNNTASSWWKDPGMRKGMVRVIICYLAVYSLGYDGSLLNGIQALPTWVRDFDSPTGYRLGLIAAAYYLPKIPGAIIIAAFSDRFGRKPCLLAGAVLMIAGAVLGGLANSYGMLVGSRVVLGVGTATSQIAAATMIPEFAHPRLRHMCGSFLNTMFYIGSIFASWLTFACVYMGDTSWAWKIPSLVQGFGPLLLLSAVFVPESPRWLIKNGKEELAHKILADYHANGDMNDELVQLEIREIKAAIEAEVIAKSTRWVDFVQTPSNRRRAGIIIALGLAAQLAGNGVVQYFLVPVLRQVGITEAAKLTGVNGGLAIFNWFCAMAGASIVEKVGRRKLILTSFSGMLGAFILITAMAGAYDSTRNPQLGLAMVAFIFIFMGFYSVALTPLPLLYIPEISPLALRSKAIALFLSTGNVCLAFNNFVNPIALTAIGWKYYFVYIGTLTAFGATFFFLFRETRGLTTEEAALVYESAAMKNIAADIEGQIAQESEFADKVSVEEIERKG